MISVNLDARIRRIVYSNLERIKAQNRHFSFITERSKVVCWGHNYVFKTHPLSARFEHRFNDIHSELAAINEFPYRLKELKYYNVVNVRVRRIDNLFGYAAPCKHCVSMLLTFGINRVIHSGRAGQWVECGIN